MTVVLRFYTLFFALLYCERENALSPANLYFRIKEQVILAINTFICIPIAAIEVYSKLSSFTVLSVFIHIFYYHFNKFWMCCHFKLEILDLMIIVVTCTLENIKRTHVVAYFICKNQLHSKNWCNEGQSR